MPFQPEAGAIRWRLHLRSARELVHQALSTAEGRARFWAESAVEAAGVITFVFPDGETWRGDVLENSPPTHFSVRYYGGSVATVNLQDDGAGGTDLTLTDVGVPEQWRTEVIAGWVSVLMALKAAVDFGVDLRNHDPGRSWAEGFAEN